MNGLLGDEFQQINVKRVPKIRTIDTALDGLYIIL